MKKLSKVRGRVTHANQIKAGMTLWRSGIGGVEKLKVTSKPFIQDGSYWVKHPFSWDSNKFTDSSLNDMGVYKQGGYLNKYNRLFKTEKQANNWQVYLKVSGLFKKHEESLDYLDDLDYWNDCQYGDDYWDDVSD